MAHRRRTQRAARALLSAAALLLAGCGGGGEPPASRDGVLTVEEALRTEGDGSIRVRGTLFADEDDVRLCTALLESYPPRCGEPSLRVRGLDVVGVSNMEQAKGLGWSHAEVLLTGELDDGVLTVATS